ncbi:MAG: hypothetical protein COB36_03270 [Alphaproteobacteria bacterium]|nr:MAG: hypothetical protein COB36_03270 [Alphaproteobacteria bacterium]
MQSLRLFGICHFHTYVAQYNKKQWVKYKYMNGISSIAERFRSLTAWSLEAKIVNAVRSKGEHEREILKAADTPAIKVQEKARAVPNAYVSDEHITVVTNGDQSLADDANMVFVNLISMLEKQGKGTPALRQEKLNLSDRLFTDRNDDPVRFTMSDLDGDYDGGPNAGLLRSVTKTLEDIGFDECDEILRILKEDNVVIRVQPGYEGMATSAQYFPERSEMKVTYAPDLDEKTKVAILALGLMHEGCHHVQNREGMLAAVAEEPDNFRELIHLNELQAHTVQYKVAMKLFAQSDEYAGFINGSTSLEDLGERWGQSDDVKNKICLAYLIEKTTGRDILNNMAKYAQADGVEFDSNDLEGYVKEALNHGEILEINDGVASYDEQYLSRMQRYAHAHISVLNFSGFASGGNSKQNDDVEQIALARGKHFSGPLGMNKDDVEVHFAAPEMVFTSAVTGKVLNVAQIEFMWEREGGSALHSLGRMDQGDENNMGVLQLKNAPAL